MIQVRLSSRHGELEDFELIDMANQVRNCLPRCLFLCCEAIEDLDKALLDSNARYAGCALSLLLILGQRVLVANVGNCRALMCTPPTPAASELESALVHSWVFRWPFRSIINGYSMLTTYLLTCLLKQEMTITIMNISFVMA